ncbi:MAG: YqiJ family protein [Pseudomonadota bacterium]
MDLFAPDMAPFTIALVLLAAIAALELVGMLFGLGVSGALDEALPDFDFDIDADADLDVDADLAGSGAPTDIDVQSTGAVGARPISQVLAWLCVGKVPILILIAAFLMGFGVSGLLIQQASTSVLGAMLPACLASVPAFFAALPVTRWLGLGLSRIMPKEETDAVSSDTFVGRAATIIRGTAKIDAPAEAKLKDALGYTHYILVAPAEAGQELAEGSDVLLVEKSGAIFGAIANTHAALQRT